MKSTLIKAAQNRMDSLRIAAPGGSDMTRQDTPGQLEYMALLRFVTWGGFCDLTLSEASEEIYGDESCQ